MAIIPVVKVKKDPKHGTYYLEYQNLLGHRRRPRIGTDEKAAQRLAIRFGDWLLVGKDPEREMEHAKKREEAKTVTAREFFQDFLDGHGSKRAEKTQASYRDSWNSLTRYSELVDIPLGDLTPDLVEKYIYTRQKRDGVSSNTVRIEFRMLSKMLGYAVRKGILAANQLQGRVELPPKPSIREVRLSDEQLVVLIAEMPNQSLRDIVEFALYTGRRKEEILSLLVENVRFMDIPEPVVTYSVQVKGGVWKRFIASSFAAEVLRRAIGNRPEGYVFKNPNTGTRYAKNAQLPLFHRTVKKLRLMAYRDGKPMKMTFHDLRHLFATDLTDNGGDIRDVQALLGHKSVTVTENYTASSRGCEALKCQRKIGA
jgi:integrase